MNEQPHHSAQVPEIGEGKRGESGYIGYLLRQANMAVKADMERTLDDLGVTQPQFLVMTMIRAYPDSSGADLARVATVTPQTMSLIVANLEKRGWIEHLPNPGHKRTQCLALTVEGAALLDECRDRLARRPSLTADLTPDEEATVRRWLVRVAQRRE